MDPTDATSLHMLAQHRHQEKVRLLGEMLGKFLRDNPGCSSDVFAAYEARTAREIGLEPAEHEMAPEMSEA